MLKEALKYLVDLGTQEVKTVVFEDHEEKYATGELRRIDPYLPKADPIKMGTLDSLIDYIEANIDEMAPKMIVHVVSPSNVQLYTKLDNYRKREYMVDVVANLPWCQFGNFMDHESFCINLQSKFIDSDDRALILKFAGTVESGTVAEYGDDGVSQKATVKTGIASKGEAIIPSPVKLRPYRTFLEVEQPASDFVFRMKESAGITCALFEADGGAWEIEAIQSIKAYLEDKLSSEQFTVIA
jgi:hypothetical protein